MTAQGQRITKAVAYTQEIAGSPAVFVDGFIYDGFGLYLARYVEDVWKVYQKPVLVVVSSDGGILKDGLAFYDYIRAKGVQGSVEIYGAAGSAATMFAAAFGKDNCSISEHSEYFLHHAYLVRWDDYLYQYLTRTDLSAEEQADLDRVNASLVNVYVQLTGKSAEEIETLLSKGDEGSSLSAEEAVSNGFCGKIIEPIASNIAAFRKIETRAAQTSETMTKTKIKVPVKLNLSQALASVTTGTEVEVDAEQATTDLLAAADKKVEDAIAERDALKAQVETLNTAVEEGSAKVTNLETEVANAKTLLTEANTAHAAAIAELKKPLAAPTVANNQDGRVGAMPGTEMKENDKAAKAFANSMNPLAVGMSAKPAAK